MLSRYTNDYMQQIIRSIMKTVNIDLEIKPDHSGINMSYNFIGNYLGVDFQRLIRSWEEIQSPISFESYINILTIHELGHALDRSALLDSLERTIEFFQTKKSYLASEIYNNKDLLFNLLEEHEMNITFEETAWMNAERLNKKFSLFDPSSFELVKKHSLESYQRVYLDDLKSYELLIEGLSEKTA
ncbi:integrase [Psychrobacillus sp. NPDC096623]|uniref:integrase n=1 Tax=Psychrobacillus sp. NPDC096623 TaxID=3364492 RepID=UPI00380FF5D5